MPIADELQVGIAQELAALAEQGYSVPEAIIEQVQKSIRPSGGSSRADTIRQGPRRPRELTPDQRKELAKQKREERARRLEERNKQKLEERVRFLTSFQRQVKADPESLRFVDAIISNRVQAAEKRQPERLHAALQEQAATYEAFTHKQQAETKAGSRRQNVFSVAASIVSLIVGWLLNALSPFSALAHILPH